MKPLSLLWLLLPFAAAHQPGEVEDVVEIGNPLISYAISGELDEPGQVAIITMDMPTDFALPFELLTPHRAAYQAFRPAYAVIAAGLPAPTDGERAVLPEEVPAGMGVYVDLNDDAERAVIFEDVLRRVYWSTGVIALPVRAGSVEIWVWSPEDAMGPFTMAFGVEEDFTGSDT